MSLRPIQSDDGQWTVAINMGCELQVALPPYFLHSLLNTVKEESKEQFAIDQLRPVPEYQHN
jgi:hypothetical protein